MSLSMKFKEIHRVYEQIWYGFAIGVYIKHIYVVVNVFAR